MTQNLEDKLFIKNQKRKTKWGPTLRALRSRRHAAVKNLKKGNKQSTSFAFKSNDDLLKVANVVNIMLGTYTYPEVDKIEALKAKELADRS
jgi:hypothetical protein